jgi:hypothetical protein
MTGTRVCRLGDLNPDLPRRLIVDGTAVCLDRTYGAAVSFRSVLLPRKGVRLRAHGLPLRRMKG